MTPVYVVVPADIDDPARPSGGNAYGRRVLDGLPAAGREVHELAVSGAWPQPTDDDRAALAQALAAVPDGADVLLDGIVACGVPEVLTAHAGRLRLVVLVHLPLGDEHGLPAAVADALTARERAALHSATLVVATSQWTAQRLTEVHDLHRRHVHVVEPGVDAAAPVTGSDTGARLLCVGSITPTKGQDLLVEALSRIADRTWTCRLVGPVVRDEAHVAAVRAAIGSGGLADRVEIVGPRTGAELEQEYATADLLVVPSRAETYGMVITEALARGIPVLGTDVGGVRSTLGRARIPAVPSPRGGSDVPAIAVDRVPGLLVAPDADALADALRSWLTDADLRARLRTAAVARRTDLDGWEVTSECLAHALTPVGVPA